MTVTVEGFQRDHHP